MNYFALAGFSGGCSGPGRLYRPKERKLRVGVELSPISSSAISASNPGKSNMVLADADDVRFDSLDIFDKAREAAQSGFQVKNFRSVDVRNKDLASEKSLYEDSTHMIAYSQGVLSIYEKDAAGSVLEKSGRHFKITEDARLTRGEDGGFELLQGAAALSGGKLKATGENEILIHKSGVDVVAGSNTTVLNLSQEKSAFSGGENVTYLGYYNGAAISGGAGRAVYGGYFANAEIEAAEGTAIFSGVFEESKIQGRQSDAFSGYFSRVEINAGDGSNNFRGMFVNGSVLNGGRGRDDFNGRYIDAHIDGGAGDDSFGNGSVVKNNAIVQSRGYKTHYYAVAADFIDSDIAAGEGDDKFEGVMHGGALDLGDGDNEAGGVFSGARVLGGGGNDDISAMYSRESVFDAGKGDDAVNLITAVESAVVSQEGSNEISLGSNASAGKEEENGEKAQSPQNAEPSKITWQTAREYFTRAGAMAHGELRANEIDAQKGDNSIDVYNGAGVDSLGNAAAVVEGARLDDAGSAPGPDSGEKARDAARPQAVQGLVSGGLSPQTGPVAATIKTGAVESVELRGIERPRVDVDIFDAGIRPRKQDDIGRVTRRSDGFGGYDWARSRA